MGFAKEMEAFTKTVRQLLEEVNPKAKKIRLSQRRKRISTPFATQQEDRHLGSVFVTSMSQRRHDESLSEV